MPSAIMPWTFLNWRALANGPIEKRVSPAGSATTTASAVALATSVASSILERGTNMRVGALHDWPEFIITLMTPAETAFWILASSNTILGDLPPNSCAMRLTVGAAPLAISMPARVEPVKDTKSTFGWVAIVVPTPGPSPLTRLNTPFGTPASCRISARIMASKGASSEGFKIMVQPVAKAGATLQLTWFIGQFHGVIKAHTPIASWRMRVLPRELSHAKSLSTFNAPIK